MYSKFKASNLKTLKNQSNTDEIFSKFRKNKDLNNQRVETFTLKIINTNIEICYQKLFNYAFQA